MEFGGIAWADGALGFVSWMIGIAGAVLAGAWRRLVELQSRYPQLLNVQVLFGVVGTGVGIWKWWETREARLFRHFERMIEGHEAQLVKARSDLLDILIRPGPGLLIRPPIFAERALRLILARRNWHSALSLPIVRSVDAKLQAAIETCDRKVSAHQDRLVFFRQQIASAHLVQGALAAARAAKSPEEHERQGLNQDALDQFRIVLAVPGHKEDLAALELIAYQMRRVEGQSQAAIDAHGALIDTLQQQQDSPSRNLSLARAKRSLAILRYPRAPGIAQGLLAEAVDLLIEFGPRRDRDLLEFAETVHLDAIARLRLRMKVQGPLQLSLAEGHYRDLLRSLRARRRGLFRWMRREGRFSGHRVTELKVRAQQGLAQVERLKTLNDKRQSLLIASLSRGNGTPNRNRTPWC